MKYFKFTNRASSIISTFFFSVLLLLSCGGTTEDIIESPSNLVIEAILVGGNATNPYGDGSGTVTFNFSANNATSYKINLGNGEFIETSTTSLTYTYSGVGINNFDIYVYAYNMDTFVLATIRITIKINPGLVWSDEFNVNGAPDSSKWGYNIGTGSNGWGNGESQYYTNRPENVIVEDGFLKITAKAESYEGSNYTSARLLSEGKFDFKYGRVDISAKLPQGEGTWPALWLLGSNFSSVGWPACGEIDIMEHWGDNPGRIASATHTPSSFGNTVNVGEITISDFATEFHVYSLEWTSNELRFLVDDTLFYTYNPTAKNSDTWPFDKEHFFILNIAVGSNYQSIDPNFVKSTMEIDYVRLYQ